MKAKTNVAKQLESASRLWGKVLGWSAMFLLLFFCCHEFGPVLRHLAEENYFSWDALPMTYVLNEPYGHLYWVGRFLMLPLQIEWIGGLYLALLLWGAAWCFDRFIGVRGGWRGIGLVLPSLLLFWASYRGYNLYMRNEPSLLILLAWGLLLVCGLGALIAALVRRKRGTQTKELTQATHAIGGLIGLISLVGVISYTYAFRQNVLISCEMQNLMLDEEWEEMNNTALKARRPDRSVAAYNVIALNQMGAVLEHCFDLDYDYPEVKLDSIGGMAEDVNYVGECNFHSGLVQPAYHYAMEQLVMGGPRLRYFKLMCLCSLLTGEEKLAERYIHIIGKMPFQQRFVEKAEAMLKDSTQILSDPMMLRVMQFLPREDKFEQNFRTPAFLGYNVGVLSGTDETLNLSVAAALYSKDLENVILRARYLAQRRTLPLPVQQALVVASFRRPGLLESFPPMDKFVQNEVQNFLVDAQPFVLKKKGLEGKEADAVAEEMKEALSERWKGSYMYYYYCGNLKQAKQHKTETAVN